MRIGILTGGGDVPGLNAAIRAVVKDADINHKIDVLGIHNGWKGAVEGKFFELTRQEVRGIIDRGGTILGSSRFHPFENEGATDVLLDNLQKQKIDALICIGGDGTLNAAAQVANVGIKLIGIPKTIDNDVYGTEYSIGHDTAVSVATSAIDRLHTTAESHNRVAIVEVMGRDHGWIAVNAGMAGGADFVIVPEVRLDIKDLIQRIKFRHEHHASYSIIVVAEGAQLMDGAEFTYQNFTHEPLSRSISRNILKEIELQTNYDLFLTVLGHVQRGGTPTAFDRNLASRFGYAAVEAIVRGDFGTVTTLNAEQINLTPFSDLAGKQQAVPLELIDVANALA
ncbi:MAG: 6-phosphofructokinase [Bifidobacteriaceae bacterium]|jgi:6-phosphofructokinase 1|nr:6-phosphofructokinase [Bifidobacteriaceae bacterium]